MSAASKASDARPRMEVVRVAATLRAHQHRTAAGLFALFVLIYLWPALVGGNVLSPGGLLWGVPPWNASLPAEGIRYYNALLSDVPMSYYPWDVLARSMIHSGTFPAWNPHAFAGTPFFGNMSVAWLGPFSLPLWTLPLDYALGVSAALKLWVAAFGTYLLVRELGLSFWPGLLAGFSFALCAFDLVWLTHQAHVAVAVLLPWLLWLVERIVRQGSRWEGVALAGVVAAAVAGGHPGTLVHVLAAALLYALIRCAMLREVAGGERLRRLATVGAGMLLGVVLMAVILLPSERAAVDTVGVQIRRADSSSPTSGGIPWGSLLAAVFPDWWGRPSEALFEGGPTSYNERAFYAGTVALLFAALALISRGAWHRKAPFLALLALGLTVPVDPSPVRSLIVMLPGFDRVQNARMVLWFAFAVAVLAAFGLQAALEAPRRQARAWAAVGLAVAAGAAAIVSIDLAPGDVGAAFDHLTDRFAGSTPGALALASVVRWLALVAVVALGLLALRFGSRRRAVAGGLIAALAAADMLLFAHAYQPMGPKAVVMPPRTPAVAYLQRHVADGRIAGVRLALSPDWSTTYGLRDVRGYDAPQPSRRFYELWSVINPTQQPGAPFDIADLSPAGLRMLSLLGTRYVVVAPGTAPPAGSGLRYAYRGADANVLENGRATPRAFVAAQVQVAADDREELAAVLAKRFDPRREAIIRRDEVGEDRPAGVTGGSVQVVEEENSRVSLRASLPHRGFVVLGDAWAPGWSVSVDGRPARALQANVVLRGVVVPAGEHTIEWRYRVPGLRAGALISGVALLALLAWAGVLLRARSRRSPRPAR